MKTPHYTAYLFVYFTGNARHDEAIRFAISDNGYHYTALNNNEPIIASEKISTTGGIRDPHIIRAADGQTFYMVATDMVSDLGWESNRGMVLLKSADLIHWTSTTINIQERFPGNDNLLRVWAPQTIYDNKESKYMIYWSMKHGDEEDKIYYAYANADFTELETAPNLLYAAPAGYPCIDGDIIYHDGQYHLFFKDHSEASVIRRAVSHQLTEGYVLQDSNVQQTPDPAEGPSIFQLNNGDGYILMYDLYMTGKYQFTRSQDLKEFVIIDDEISMNFHPRHGSVISITSVEANRLINRFGI